MSANVRQLTFGIALIASALARRADAQVFGDRKAVAQGLFDEARVLVEKERFLEACPKFAESLRLDAGIGTALWLGDCYENLGRPASAWAAFEQAASMAVTRHDDRERVARARAARLEPRLSRVTIAVTNEAWVPGLQVRRDESLVAEPEWGTALPLDPGPHTIVATAPRRRAWSTRVVVTDEGTDRTISVPTLELTPSLSTANPEAATAVAIRSAPAASPPPAGALSPQRAAGIALAGAGMASLIVGGVFAFWAKAAYDDSSQGNPAHCSAKSVCDPTGLAERGEAFSRASAATAAVAAGLGAAAAGSVLFLTAPNGSVPSVASAGSLTGASIRLRWAF